jgi:hypothetical protein
MSRLRELYGLDIGDRVCHVKDDTLIGVITEIDDNLPDITTCRVLWAGETETDIQWTNKLVLVEMAA